MGLGENEAVTPAGSPETANVTLPEKLGFAWTNTALFVEVAPTPTESPPLEEMENDGVAMVRERVVVIFWLPDVPVMVSVLVPTGAEAVAERVRTALPPVATGFAENDAETPLGTPEMDRLTLPLKPFTLLT